LAVMGRLGVTSRRPLLLGVLLVGVTWGGWQLICKMPVDGVMGVKSEQVRATVTGDSATAGITGVPSSSDSFRAKLDEYQQAPGEANQASCRLAMYQHGLEAWMDRPLLGHGAQLVSGYDAPYQGLESHNSLIDWADFTGIVGILPLVCWFGFLIRRAWRENNIIGFTALVSLGVFAQFHLVVRQPLFWLLAQAFASLPVNKPTQSQSVGRPLASDHND